MNKRCEHYWCYNHTVWEAEKHRNGAVAVGRYCLHCGKMETATAKKWRPLPRSYVDMRETLTTAFKNR